MKFYLSAFGFLFTTLIIQSCGSENVENENGITTHDEFADNPDTLLATDNTEYDLIIEAFPKNWINIEATKDGNVVHEYCDIPTPFVRFVKETDYWKITTGYGHDAEDWAMINMTSKVNSFNGQELQEGILIVEKISYPDDEMYEINYFWNKTAGFCTFGDFFQPDTKFANEEAKDSYTVVEEPCDM